jgi:hypothetical protein
MNTEYNFFVYHPLRRESWARLESLQKEYCTIKSFSPVESLHLTILSGRTKRPLQMNRLQTSMKNASKVSEGTFTSEIVKAQMDTRAKDVTRLALRLIVDHASSAHYAEEYEILKNSVNTIDNTMIVRKFQQPHVTLGYLNAGDGLASIMERAGALVGTTLRFGPIESNIGKPDLRVAMPHTGPSTPMAIDVPVRTLRPGSIPNGLLSSFRPPDSHD